MIHIPCVQGSPEWFLARMGIPTASMFKKFITPTKGELSQNQNKTDLSEAAYYYIDDLIGDYFTKLAYPDGPPWGFETYQNAAMRWGTECEAQARSWYAMTHDVDVQQCGFITTDDGRFGCSPDFLVGAEGCGELKCPKPGTMIGWLRAGTLPDEHKLQVHGELSISQREWIDFVAYCPAMPAKLVVRVTPDTFTAKVEAAMRGFYEEFQRTLAKIQNLS